jgi:hypothetical protein
MGRSSTLGPSRMHGTEKHCGPGSLVFAFVVVFVVIFVGCGRPALAAISCGQQPENLPVEGGEQFKHDVADKANLILHAPAGVNLRFFVAAKRRELRQKYPDVDRSTLDHYLLWTTCQTISNDPTLAVTQKFDEYSNFYRLMTEPVTQAAGRLFG